MWISISDRNVCFCLASSLSQLYQVLSVCALTSKRLGLECHGMFLFTSLNVMVHFDQSNSDRLHAVGPTGHSRACRWIQVGVGYRYAVIPLWARSCTNLRFDQSNSDRLHTVGPGHSRTCRWIQVGVGYRYAVIPLWARSCTNLRFDQSNSDRLHAVRPTFLYLVVICLYVICFYLP